MEDLKQTISEYSSRNLEARKNWYSPAAEAYDRVRPRYPQALIERVVEIAQLSDSSKILEIGCGPGTATLGFAPLGCSILGLEPNPDFYRLAQQNCAPYPQVTIQNTSFEEWDLEAGAFDAVLAATSFHWISPDVGYPKVAAALSVSDRHESVSDRHESVSDRHEQDGGHLILLWNKELQPRYEVYQRLADIYQIHAPALARYESPAAQAEILRQIGQMVIDSGQFRDLHWEWVVSEVNYTVEEYLMLLSTYSPYLMLEPPVRDALFAELGAAIEQQGGRIQLSYLSAFHIARKG